MELSPFEFSPPPSDDDELPFSTGDEAEDDEDEPYHLDEPTSERALYSFEYQPRDVARRTTEMREFQHRSRRATEAQPERLRSNDAQQMVS